MRKTNVKLTKSRIGKKLYLCVTWPAFPSGRQRKFFKNSKEGREQAEAFLDLKKVEKENHGTAAAVMSERDRVEFLECLAMLAPHNLRPREALKMLLPQLEIQNQSRSVRVLVDELIAAKKRDGASARYLGDLKSRLKPFAAGFDEVPISKVSKAQVDEWLRALKGSAITRNNYRRLLIVMWNFAIRRGYCVKNAAEESAKAKVVSAPPGVLSPTQLSGMLGNAADEIVPFIAIGAFAGLRRAELEKLDWAEVDLESGLVCVTADNAKSARRRFVRIQPNLDAWLRPLAKQSGPVAPGNLRPQLEAAARSVGFGTPGTETEEEKKAGMELTPWPSNALRHSFASYHLAHFKDSATVSLEMGHKDSGLVFEHYRELVRPKDAATYWTITPSEDAASKIVSIADAA